MQVNSPVSRKPVVFRIGTVSQQKSLILLEDSLDVWEKVEGEEGFVGALVRPAGFEAEFVTDLEPVSDLFDGCLFEIGGERVLAGAGCSAGKNVATGIGQTTSGWLGDDS